jgi:choice-of-anchor C domain-containing protein
MNFLKTTTCAGLICLSGCLASANSIPIANGSFENPVINPVFINTSTLPGWTVVGNIDQIGTYWQAADGKQSIDLDGNSAGTIKQVIFLPGGSTQVHFDMAGNPDNAPAIKTLEVSLFSAGGSQTFSFNVTGHTHASMGWILETADFGDLPAGNYTLQFKSLTPGAYGAALDNVSVTVPDGTTTATLLGAAMLAMIGHSRLTSAPRRVLSGVA